MIDGRADRPALAIRADTELAPGLPRPGQNVVEVRDLNVAFKYPRSVVPVVSNVNLTLRRDETLVLVGESGSGKSVTARAVIGLLPDTAIARGSVIFDGQEVLNQTERQWARVRATGISMVFQDPMRSLNPTMRVGIQISEVLERHFGMTRSAALRRGIELLDVVGIASPKERIHDYPHQLSGGMRQRVMIAIAIACNPRVLLADEPTTSLDVTLQDKIMVLLRELKAEFHMAMLLITHDMGLAFSYGDVIAVMYAGRIVERASGSDLHTSVRMPYTRGLLDSVPRLSDLPHSEFHALPGRPPNPGSLGVGCAFAPRCAYVQERCTSECPAMDHEGDHEWACWNPL